jgi:hypothetical protein
MGTCESCGRDGTDVEAVERVYLVPAETPGDGLEPQPTGEVERWCASCREQYPHRPV